MTTVQQQARALGDPTRYAIYRYVLEADQAVGVAEMTVHFKLNHNAIRQHLAKLAAASLVIETVGEGAGRGRRPLLYAINPAADSRWGVVGPYERLSHMLAEIIRTGDNPVVVGVRAARQFRATRVQDGLPGIAAAMALQGFNPEVRGSSTRPEIVLHDCPFASTALADRETVCSLHLGIANGLAEGTGHAVEELLAKDPRRANCRLRLRALLADDETPPPTGRLRLARL